MAKPINVEVYVNAAGSNLPPDSVIFGCLPAMQLLRDKIIKIAATDVPVLITGESGTGKELLAKMLHFQSPWSDGPFVKVSCPAIPATLLESELFGYEKGAFTGAYGTKPGRVELANRGTLFLDEIGEMEIGLQAKLLQLLQDGQFSRIGAQEDKRVEVRVVCATNRRLDKEIEAGSFRSDLYYRINVVDLHLLPLRERKEDIPTLANYFLGTHSAAFNCAPPPISARLMHLLKRYEWPGNIRQLENLIKRYVILGTEEAIMSDLVGGETASAFDPEIPINGSISLKKITQKAVMEIERRVILKTLQAHHWNRRRAAKALSISYRALLYKIRQADLPSARAPSPAAGSSSTLAAGHRDPSAGGYGAEA